MDTQGGNLDTTIPEGKGYIDPRANGAPNELKAATLLGATRPHHEDQDDKDKKPPRGLFNTLNFDEFARGAKLNRGLSLLTMLGSPTVVNDEGGVQDIGIDIMSNDRKPK